MYIRFTLCMLVILAVGCQRVSTDLHPVVVAPAHPKEVQRETRNSLPRISPSLFPPLTGEELSQDWGKNVQLGLFFAGDFDLYRAITFFKCAALLIPPENKERALEINYYTTLSYYLGKKYVEAIYSVESTELICADANFAPFADLLLILFDSYKQCGKLEKANHILALIEAKDPSAHQKLCLLSALEQGKFSNLTASNCDSLSAPYIANMYNAYKDQEKSICKAQVFNALLPGAGYWYVGQKQTAITAFLMNGLFIGATAYFFHEGNIPAGVIFASFESGWYFGGIYGGGLAVKSYNERLYESYANKITNKEGCFPTLMLKYLF